MRRRDLLKMALGAIPFAGVAISESASKREFQGQYFCQHFNGVDFSNCRIEAATFYACKFSGCKFPRDNEGGEFENCNFADCETLYVGKDSAVKNCDFDSSRLFVKAPVA